MAITYNTKLKKYRRERWIRINTLINWFKNVWELNYINSFYDYRDKKNRLDEIEKEISSLKFYNSDFEITYRILRSKYNNGLCDYDFDFPIYSPELIDKYSKYDENLILIKMYDKMKLYWDEVLSNYKRECDKIKRIKYLKERLDEEMRNPLISSFPDVILSIKQLKDYYSDLMADH